MNKYRIVSCDKCGTQISVKYPARTLIDVDSSVVGVYCVLGGCFEEISCNLINKRFVQHYKNKTIYQKNNMFFPYWRSPYYYNSLQECKDDIDTINFSASEVEELG